MIKASASKRIETTRTRIIRYFPTRTAIQTKHAWDPQHRSALPGTEEQLRSPSLDVREAIKPGW